MANGEWQRVSRRWWNHGCVHELWEHPTNENLHDRLGLPEPHNGRHGRLAGKAMRRTTNGRPDVVKPPVRVDEGQGWGRKRTTVVC